MAIHNADIAQAFDEIADLLEIQDGNPFRVRAYRNAARTVENLSLDLAAVSASGKPLPKLPGIGQDLAGKISEIAATGTCTLLKSLRKELPPAVTESCACRHSVLSASRRSTTNSRCRRFRNCFGQPRKGAYRPYMASGRLEAELVDAVHRQLSKTRRFRLAVAAQYAEPLAQYLRGVHGVDQVVVAGKLPSDARYGRRSRPPRDGQIERYRHGSIHGLPRSGRNAIAWGHPRERTSPLRHSGGPASGRAGLLRRSAALLHGPKRTTSPSDGWRNARG